MIGIVTGLNDPRWRVPHTIALAKLYMEDFGNLVGGNLHIVLSDGNVEAGHVQFCLDEAQRQDDHVGVALAKCLAELSEAQRQEVYEAL